MRGAHAELLRANGGAEVVRIFQALVLCHVPRSPRFGAQGSESQNMPKPEKKKKKHQQQWPLACHSSRARARCFCLGGGRERISAGSTKALGLRATGSLRSGSLKSQIRLRKNGPSTSTGAVLHQPELKSGTRLEHASPRKS